VPSTERRRRPLPVGGGLLAALGALDPDRAHLDPQRLGVERREGAPVAAHRVEYRVGVAQHGDHGVGSARRLGG